MMGDLAQETVCEGLPPMAVPITVKMPEPMTAPMPRAVSDNGPSVFFSARSGSSESRMSLSMDLQASSWLGSAILLELTERETSDSVDGEKLKPQCT